MGDRMEDTADVASSVLMDGGEVMPVVVVVSVDVDTF